MRLITFCFITSLFLSISLLAQVTDTSLARVYLDSSEVKMGRGQFEEALAYGRKTLDLSRKFSDEKSLLTATAYNQIGDVLIKKGDLKKAMGYIRRSLHICQQLSAQRSQEAAHAYFIEAHIHFAKGRYARAMEAYQKSLNIRREVLGDDHQKVANSLQAIGLTYYALGELEKALEYNQRALEISTNQAETTYHDLASTYNNLGLIFNRKGELDKSLSYFHQSINTILSNKTSPNFDISHVYNNVGMMYNNMGEYEKALSYFEKSLAKRIEIFGLSHPFIAGSYTSIGNAYQHQGKYKEAFGYYQNALELSRKALGEMHPRTANSYTRIASNHHKQKEYGLALKNYRRALEIQLQVFGQQHPEVASSFTGIGKAYLATDAYSKAKEYALKALAIWLKNYGELHPKLAATYGMLGDISLAKKDYSDALKYFVKAVNTLDELKKVMYSGDSRQLHLAENYRVFENAIKTILDSNRESMDQAALKQAFLFAEKSKASLLQESLNASRAKYFAGIPDSLLEHEDKLKRALAYLEKTKFKEQERTNDQNDSLIQAYNARIFEIQQQHEKLIRRFENNYPEYYNLKYKTEVISATQIQRDILQPDQALLEYFVGDSSIFVFILSPDAFQIHTIKKDFPLQQWTNQMRIGIYQYQLSGNNDEDTYVAYSDTFAFAAHQLYQKLLAPLKKNLPEKLIIIPDGALNYIPFEALLVKAPTVNYHYKNHSYLIEDHQISYCYSATFLQELNRKHTKASKGFLAFAPSFRTFEDLTAGVKDRKKAFRPLQFSTAEVRHIQKLLGGNMYIGEKATKENFIRLAHNYQILHLASHGKANDKSGVFSFLVFSDVEDSLENNFLYVRDLYNLTLNADLVVLSACETGVGELKRGEGVISLARGFAYAGAKSIVTTLWSVSDKNTKDLLILFYKNIKAGMAKDEALRKAKLSYIQQHSHREAHPFFWASLVPMGNMAPVTLASGIPDLNVLTLLLFIVFGIAWWVYKNRK